MRLTAIIAKTKHAARTSTLKDTASPITRAAEFPLLLLDKEPVVPLVDEMLNCGGNGKVGGLMVGNSKDDRLVDVVVLS